jgi:hypothetical protein
MVRKMKRGRNLYSNSWRRKQIKSSKNSKAVMAPVMTPKV